MSYYHSPPLRRRDPHLPQGSDEITYHPMLALCPPKWASKAMAVMLVVSAVVIILYLFQPMQNEISVLVVDTNGPPTHVTNHRYLSVALDSSLIANDFEGFDMRSPKLEMMMLPLGGAYLRIGGTMADRLIFMPNKLMRSLNYDPNDVRNCASEENKYCFAEKRNFTLSGRAWIELNWLAARTNYTIIFDLNALRRKRNGAWDSSNAAALIAFSNQRGMDLVWELGNEPNSYRHVFNYEVSGQQMAQDFSKLRQILRGYPRYSQSLLVGPDVTKPKQYNAASIKYLMDFLLEMPFGVLNAITFHQYYFNGRDAHLSSFLNPDIFDTLEMEIWAIQTAAKKVIFGDLPIWLGETSSAYGGGSPRYSDKFAATFIWLDKLGLAAKSGVDLIIRQSLFKGHYALLDENYDPNPDWWISVIYKKLVGPEVKDCMLISNSRVRLYCHCAKKDNGYVDTPSIVVFGSNVNYSPAFIRLMTNNFPYPETFTIIEFILQTHESIVSKDVYLNLELLEMQPDGQIPTFLARNLTTNTIMIPPYSLGFWLIPITNC